MTKEDILNDLHEIFKEVFELDSITLDPQTSALDIEDWDSLTHIQLVAAIEKKFKIRFDSREIRSWMNVGDILNDTQTKINSN